MLEIVVLLINFDFDILVCSQRKSTPSVGTDNKGRDGFTSVVEWDDVGLFTSEREVEEGSLATKFYNIVDLAFVEQFGVA